MVNPYLNIFLKKKNIQVIESVFYGGGQSETQLIKGGAGNDDQYYDEETSSQPTTTSVAGKIGSAINSGDQLARKGIQGLGSGLIKGTKMAAKGLVYGVGGLTAAVPYTLYKGVKHGIVKPLTQTSPEHVLAQKIVKSIQNALAEVNLRNNVIQEDIEKIQKLVVPNQIDLNYGGGILIFDGKFNILQTLYFCFQEDTPISANESIDPSNTEPDFLNHILNTENPPYNNIQIARQIMSVM
jgi:hypothetical protein